MNTEQLIVSEELKAKWREEAPRYRDGGAGRESWLIDKAANQGFEWGRESVNEFLAVNLTYFKRGGKFYDKGNFRVHKSVSLFQIWDDVIKRRDSGNLPGLVEGAGKGFIILVNVPGHDHQHPRLIMPDANH
jgi:hypothetical protein